MFISDEDIKKVIGRYFEEGFEGKRVDHRRKEGGASGNI